METGWKITISLSAAATTWLLYKAYRDREDRSFRNRLYASVSQRIDNQAGKRREEIGRLKDEFGNETRRVDSIFNREIDRLTDTNQALEALRERLEQLEREVAGG